MLVLYSQNRLVPGNVAVDRGLRAALGGAQGLQVDIFSEFLDRRISAATRTRRR